MDRIHLYTIGFTRKNAETFFALLENSGAKRTVDVRLNNVSQLAGFAKRDDLKFFAKRICGLDYIHLPNLAPTKDILDAFKKNGGDWSIYEEKFRQLMEARAIENSTPPELIDGGCLLCSEHLPDSGSRPDFEHDVLFVVGIFGKEKEHELLFELFAACFELF